jgi:hypothetical protein
MRGQMEVTKTQNEAILIALKPVAAPAAPEEPTDPTSPTKCSGKN